MEMLSFKNLFLLRLQDNMCSYLYFSTLQTIGKEPLKKMIGPVFTWVHVGAICTHLSILYTPHLTPHCTCTISYSTIIPKQKYLPMFWPLTSTLWR